ncbi:MAG TPA: glycine zipper 2TM domain-containing protein, partial [Gammaproteobacteria bacterium]|nr:glycine zipper 2TM domain-containing protein [Gammaproteobacteria bacterium]
MSSKLYAATVLIGLGVAHGALADHGPGPRVVFAPVVDVEPLVRQVTVTRPREDCWLETAVVPTYRPGPVIAGGLIGSVLGHQIGHGHRNDAMTLLGAFVGSAVGADIASRRSSGREVTTRRCELVHETHTEERIDGYRVTYDYMGQR